MGFRTGVEAAEKAAPRRPAGAGGSGVFEAAYLPDAAKERLCRSLLAELGVTHVRPSGDGELIHGCLLPFSAHRDQDRNPTASLNYRKLTYNCFGCGAGGGLLWFLGMCRDEDGEQARRWLEEQTGSGAEEQSLSSLMEFFDAIYEQRRESVPVIPRMDAKVLNPWLAIHPYMTDPKPEGRGIAEETLTRFKVGYGEIRCRVDREDDDASTEPLYVQSHRIVIPHFWKGSLVGWQTRRLMADGTPKYLSSPDFPKETTIYNYDAKQRTAVAVESPMSVLSRCHLDPHIEGTFGAKVTDRQVRLLSMHPKVILFMDNDPAGWNATHQIAARLEGYSEVWVAQNRWRADPADLDDETFLACVADPVPYAVWRQPDEGELVRWAA